MYDRWRNTFVSIDSHHLHEEERKESMMNSTNFNYDAFFGDLDCVSTLSSTAVSGSPSVDDRHANIHSVSWRHRHHRLRPTAIVVSHTRHRWTTLWTTQWSISIVSVGERQDDISSWSHVSVDVWPLNMTSPLSNDPSDDLTRFSALFDDKVGRQRWTDASPWRSYRSRIRWCSVMTCHSTTYSQTLIQARSTVQKPTNK